MRQAGSFFAAAGLDSASSAHVGVESFWPGGDGHTIVVPDAHLLFSGDFHRSGQDLILSDPSHHFVVPHYFHGSKRPTLVSPEGAPLDPKVIEALTGHVELAQAGGAPAGKVVAHIVKMTGSASVVRNGVTAVLNVGDVIYQNDVVQTGSGSSLGLVLEDGTAFNLTANARLMLNDLTYDASSTSNSSLITLVQGAASFVAGQVAKTGDMRVATPVAVIGVRGTAVQLDISSADGRVSVSVLDQGDGLVHAVQVYDTRGNLIGTVTSNSGTGLTLTPTATFEVIAQLTNKNPADVAREFNAFQSLLSTYDAGKVMFPNLPQHTRNDPGGGDNNTSPGTTKYAGSTPATPPGTEFQAAVITASSNAGSSTPAIVVVTPQATSPSGGSGGPTNSTPTDTPTILAVNVTPVPFVVTPSKVASITSGGGDHTAPVMSASGDVVYDPDGIIYFYDRESGATIRVTPDDGRTYSGQTISSDGRYVVYQGTNGGPSNIYVWGTDPADSAHYHVQTLIGRGGAPAVSGDGSIILAERGGGIVIYDLQGHQKGTISAAAVGGSGSVWLPSISADGHIIAFWHSDSANPGGSGQLYVYDSTTAIFSEIATVSSGAGVHGASLSADGHYVVYQGQSPGGRAEIYLYDLVAGHVVFTTENTPEIVGGASRNPVISPDGHYIIFTSDAQITNDDGNAFADTYVVDVTNPAAPVFALVSQQGNAASDGGVAISAGGIYVAFASNASFSGGNAGSSNIFVVDPSAGHSAIIQETANSPSNLTASGVIVITGGTAGVTLSVTDADGNPTSLLSAAFNSGGNIQWDFSEAKSDFASLSFGQDLVRQFIVTMSSSGGTTTIPVSVTVHNAVQPTIVAVDAPPVAVPVTLPAGSINTTYVIADADLFAGVSDVDGPLLTITNVSLQSGIGSVQQDVSGNWVFSPGPNYNGAVVLSYTVSDGTFSASSTASLTIDGTAPNAPSISMVTDDTPPATGALASGDSSNDTDLTVKVDLNGTNAVAGDTVQLYNGTGTGSQLGTSYTLTGADIAAGFANVQTGPLSNGTTYLITARVTDQVGNQSAASGSFTVIEDTTAPTATVAITAIATDSAPGGTNNDFITNDTTLTVSGTNGTLGSGEKVQVSTDGVNWADVAQSSGTWTYTDPATHNTSFTYQVRVVDTAGNVGNTASQVVTIDITPPTAAVAITAIATDSAPGGTNNDFITNDTTLTVSGTNGTLGSGEKVQISTDGGATWVDVTQSSGTWSYTDSATHNTSFTYQVRVVDTAGNVGNTASQAVTIDTTAPTAAVAITAIATDSAPGGTNNDFITNDTTLTVSGTNGTLGSGEKVQVSTDGVSWADVTQSSGSWTYTDPATHNTSFTYQVRVVDTAGNVGNTASQAVTIDTTAPTAAVAITAIATDSAPGGTNNDFITNDTTLTVSGTNGTLGSGEKVQISTDGGATWVDVTQSSGTWTYTDPATHNTTFTYQVRVVDTAGNVGNTASQAVTIDTTAPTAAVAITAIATDSAPGGTNNDFITNDTTLTVSGTNGTLGSGEKVQVSTDGVSWADVTQSSGSWTYTDPATHNTSFTYQVRVVDTAGNVGNTASQAVTIDTTAPNAPSIASVTDDVPPVTGTLTSGGSTNDTDLTVRVSLTGTGAVAGDTVQLYNGTGTGNQLGTSYTLTSTDIGNGFANAQTGTLTNGTTYTITARVTDQAGNQSGASGSFVVTETGTAPNAPSIMSVTDDVLPVTGTLTSGGSTNDTDLTVAVSLSGTGAVAGDTVQLYNGTGTGSQLGTSYTLTTTDIGNGVVNLATGTLTNGTTYTITARVTDQAGNQSSASSSFTVTEDTTAPTAVATVTALSSDTGAAGDFVTNVASQTVSGTYTGTLGSGEKIQVSADGTTWVDATAGAGTFTASGVTLQAGNGTLSVRTIDTAGNTTAGSGHGYTLDTTAPTAVATVTALSSDTGTAGDFITNVASQTVSGTYTGTLGSGEKIQVSADGTTWVDATASAGTFTASGVTLQAGNGTLSVRTIDTAGNVTAGTSHGYTLDTTAPTAVATVTALSSDTGTAGDFVTSVASQTVSGTYTGTLGSGEKIQVSADGSTWIDATASAGTFTASGVTLQAGNGTLSVRTIDTAGNTTAGSGHGYTLDTTAPTAVATVTALSSDTGTAGDFITSVASQTISGTYAGTLGSGEKIQVSADGSTWIDATAGAGTFTASGVTLQAGNGTLSVRTIDTAGNTTAGSGHGYTLDTTAPTAVATVTALSSDTGTAGDFITSVASQTVSGTYTGTLGSGEKIQVSADGSTWIDATASAGTFTASGVTLQAGNSTLSVRTIDIAGNATAGSGHGYTLDTAAPTAVATVTALSSDTGTAGDFVTSVASQTVSGTYAGTLGSGEKIQVSADGSTWIDATASAGTFTASGVTLQAGNGTLSVRTIDIAGNATAGSGHGYTLDTAAPTAAVAITAIATDSAPGGTNNDFITNDTTLTVSGTNGTLGSGEKVQVSTDGVNWADVTPSTGTTWTYTDPAVHNTSFTYQVRVVDTAGNVGNTASQAVTIDTTAPNSPSITSVTDNVPPITGTVPDNGSTDDATLTIAGAAETGSTVTIYDTDGTTVVGTGVAAGGTYSITTSVLSQGDHTLTVKATDAAGNQSAASTAFHVNIDTTAPSAAVAITSVSGSSSPGSTAIIVSGTSGILAAGDKIQISTDGVTWTDVSRTSLTRWTFTDSTLRTADFTYLTRVVDSVGNVGSTASQPVKVVYNGATAAVSGAAPVVAAFTGTGGNLQIAAGGLSATLNAISVAAGAVEISGGGNITTSTGDAIDLYATGANASGPANLTVDPTGQVIGAATGISVTQNATGSITITTSGPVTGLAGRGISAQQTATGSGSILVNGSGQVTGTGTAFSGITAFNQNSANNGDVTISQSGNVTGGHDGIYARTFGNGNVTVNTGTNAQITGLTLYGIEAQSRGTGNIQVTTASGTKITSAGAGINAYNEATVLPKSGNVIVSSISVTANGTIDSGTTLTGAGNRPAGILAGYRGGTINTPNPSVFGNVGINNFATINAAGGDGIRGYNYGSSNVTISNAATIVARDMFGITGTSYGSGNVAVTTTSGSSITSGSHGILAINQANAVGAAAGSTVTVTANGTINAGVHLTPGGASPSGISAGYYGPSGFPNTSINGTVLVDNYANITSRGQFGIIAFNVGYGNVTVISRTGTSVRGLQYGIGANSSVPGTASPSDIAVTVESGATVTASALSGIAAISANNTSGGNISISTGAGATFQSGGTGITANVGAANVASGKQISITTSTGTINSGFNFFSGGGTPSGISAGYSPGNFNANVYGNIVVDNSATITAASGPGVNVYNNGNGSISATLRPSSSVTALQGGGVTAFSAAGGNITIDNQGTINAAAVGISANNGSGNSVNGLISIANSGTVNAPGVPFIPVVTVGNGNSGQTATVSNSVGKAIASTLFARTTNNFAFSFYAGNGSITNNGSITGNISFSGSGSFTNAAGGFWNLNGSNFFGNGASTINNAGFMNISGLAGLSAVNAIALANTGNIFVLPNSSAQIFGNVTGVGSINLGDRSALELGLAVAATQTINFSGRGLLTFDGPGSVGANLPLNFTSGTNGNVGSIITLQGGGITAANVSGSTLTITGVQNYAFQVSGSGLSGNIFNVLSPDRIILIPAIGAGTTIVSNNDTATNNNSPAVPVNFYSVYVLDNNHISGTGSGYNLSTADSAAANTYALVVNSNSYVSVTGSGNSSGLRVATSGASGAIVSAASSISAGDFGINVNIGAGSGNADIVDYGNVTGGQSAIAANTLNGSIRIFAGPGANLTGTTSFGIVGSANGSGGVNIATSGGTISGGITGITAVARQATPSSASVVVYNSSNVTGGTNGATANVAGSGASGIRAGILANNGTNFDPPNTAITGDVTIESRGNITALYGSGLHAYNYGAGNTSVTFLPGQYAINAVNAGVTTPGNGLVQYGIFAFTYGKGSSLVNAGWGTTITSGGTGINAGNQATAIASGSGSTVSVYSQGFISSGANLNNSGSAPSAIQAGYNPAGNGQFSSAVYGDVIVNVASDGNPFGNPNPTLLAAAGPGILAYNYGVGNITVSVGSGVSIQALTAASASGGGNAPYGIAATNRGPGNISVITSSGSSINSGSSGINAVNDANPTAGSDLANLFAANAIAGNPAVIAVTAAGSINSGNLLTNAGNTPSGIAAGFFGANGHANQYVGGNVFINNAAVITAAGYGLQGYNFGYGNITINEASGANITAGSHGIYAHADGGFTDPVAPGVLTRDIAVTVNANTTIIAGTASSTAYGIFALSTNAGNMSVVTSTGDTIDSHTGGAGINVVNEATSIAPSFNSSLLVSNAAAIHSGAGLTGFGNQPAGILAGYIGQATSPGPSNPANYNVHGEVSVYNSGNITADAGDGIRAYNYGVGDIYVNNFAGTIVASGGASPPNGSGIGILAQNFGPGSVHLTTSATTSITSGSSGIVAVNKATTADPLNPTVVVPATSEVDVYASGTIHSGTTPTGSGDPPAGILAGYNPNNLNTPNNAVHGSVFVDSHATILAPAGTDGIRGVNYGDGDITIVVESDSDVTGGRFGVAALGYNGGDVSVTIRGSVVGQTAALDADTTGSGTVTIDNAGYLGGLVIGGDATFTIEAGADWQFSGANIFTGTTSTLANAGTIETRGVSSIGGLTSFTNSGLIAVDSGSLTIGTPVTGGGAALIYDASLVLTGASDMNVRFADINPATGGMLVLQDPVHFTGTVTGFTFGDTIDLTGIAPASVSVTNNSGFLQVNFAGGAVQLLGNYDPSGFSIISDGGTGTLVSWSHGSPSIDTTQFTLVNNPDNSTTVLGLHVNDADAAATLTMTAVTAGAASGTTITPSASSGLLATINGALSGVTYDPGATPPAIEKITLSVVDNWGVSDTVNFIFTPGSSGGGGVTLTGTSGNDVIFSTGGPDTLTGGTGRDQFVFGPDFSSSVQDTITDFVEGVDRIDVREFSGISSANIQNLIQAAQTAQASGLTGNDTLLTLDSVNHITVLLKNVQASSLQAGDFIVHS